MRIATAVTRLLGIDLPIVASGPAAFAASVSEAGGLGVLAADGPERTAAAIDQLRAATSRPFAVRLPPDAALDTADEWPDLVLTRPVPVLLTAGRLLGRSVRIRAAGTLHLHAVTSLEQASEAAGVDTLLVEGGWALLRAVAAGHPGMPMVAPDGVDGAGLAVALALGAGAAQFAPCPSESGGDLVRRVAAEYAAAVRALPIPSVTPPRDPGRALREAAALRENLRKRKDQARARDSEP